MDSELLQIIMDKVPVAIVVVEKPDGKVVYANERAVKLYGSNPYGFTINGHAPQLRIFTLDGKLCLTKNLFIYRALFYGETTSNAQLIFERPDAKRFFVNVTAKPLYDNDGIINASVAIFDDMTERIKGQEALKESEERLNLAQKIAKLGSWEYYVKEDKAVWSDELFEIFGLKPQAYGPNIRSYINLIHPGDREKVVQQMQQLNVKTGKMSTYDYRIIRSDGSIRTIHSENMIREIDEQGKPLRVMGVEQDITERKQIEEKLADYSLNLEKIVQERTKQLREAECLSAIGQIAGMVGHDIRNPLQTIANEIYLTKNAIDKLPKTLQVELIKESINTIEKQTAYINKIVKELHELAKPLTPEFVEVDLCTAVPEAISTVKIPSNIQLNVFCKELALKLRLDVDFLKRIMINLVANAIQAMPQGGKIIIRIDKEKNSAIIIVEDTGIGIPKEMHDKLFTPLFTTKSKGQGFGLVSIKRMINALRGTINFNSEEGNGTKFIIRLPLTNSLTDDL